MNVPGNTKLFSILGGAVAALAMTGVARAGGYLDIAFGDTTFPSSTIIDNPYWPLLPAGVTSKTFKYVNEGEDECVVGIMSVTQGDTKSDFIGDYAGHTAQVVADIEWVVDQCGDPLTDDALAEWTYDWFMQDEYQNIWYLGENTRSFDEGCPSVADVPFGTPDWSLLGYGDLQAECTAGSWEAGQPGPEEGFIAEAGIVVPGDMPLGVDALTPGTFYMQELAEGAEDMAKILRLNATVSVDEGQFSDNEYENCRMVKEWTGLEPGGSVEHKFYCAGPGLLLVQGIGGGPTEAEVLVEVTQTP